MPPNNSPPKVSIVIPVYNGARYLRSAIDSALAQTYDNIEVIVVDDGSTDTSAEVAKSYGDKIRLLTKPNGGCGSALNVGIAKMTGQYFSWLSHDDVYLPDKIKLQMQELQKLPNTDTILYSSFEVIDPDSNFVRHMHVHKLIPPEKRDVPLYALLRGLINGCTLLIPSILFSTVGRFDETLHHTQDFDLFFKLFRATPVHFCDQVVLLSREHPEQASRIREDGENNRRLDECNRLWMSFLDHLTDDEMRQMEKTPYAFLRRVAAFLSKTDYARAADYARQLAERRLEEIKISLVMPFHNRVDQTLVTIESVLRQKHQNFELILVNDGATVLVQPILDKIANDARIKYMALTNRGYHAAAAEGTTTATGTYIVYLDSNLPLEPDLLTTHLRCKADDLFWVNLALKN